MQALATATQLDWYGWIRGIVGAFVSGGAGAIGGGAGAVMFDPQKFNIHDGLSRTLELMGVVFVFSAIVSLMKFLQTHPVPDMVGNAPQP